MLADKDRIFTNLYGFHDFGLEGALKTVLGIIAHLGDAAGDGARMLPAFLFDLLTGKGGQEVNAGCGTVNAAFQFQNTGHGIGGG